MKKRLISIALALALSYIMLPMTSFAGNSYSTISSVKIIVDDYLKNLEYESGTQYPELNDTYVSVPDQNRYEVSDVTWHYDNDSSYLKVGASPKVAVYLSAGSKEKSNGDEIIYRFSGAYTASNVTVSGGDFVSARRISADELEVIFTIPAVTGDYDAPSDATWSDNALGMASWNAPTVTSGYYEVTLKREGSTVVKITTNTINANLYPWMTRSGDYTFTVRTIPYTDWQKKYGSRSEEIESNVLSITDSNKSNGTGKYDTTHITADPGNAAAGTNGSGNAGNGSSQNTSTLVGWYQSGNTWYFRYPNGQPIVGQWLSWKGKWYHFNTQGQMETGWYKNAYGRWFYLDPHNGDMKTGWRLIDNTWYYFNPTKDANEGSMFQSMMADINGKTYYFDDKGHMKTGWAGIKDASGIEQYYYFKSDGQMARSETVDGFALAKDGRWIH
ncbi:N-acetylmuramoyl-L-alanine amidase family protein [Oribacterium sp. HCP28S3_H8]|uniref:N-acetylmuramoyl-L-alanine amidase family protein n=1 Tax=Oribacterium sp. HCP28S3_H8 TaxID=3438945 RepID=UPI003F8C36FC